MDTDKYIQEKIDMLKNGFSHTQVRKDIFRHVFKTCIPNLTIDSMIDRCMVIYGEVIEEYNASDDKDSYPTANDIWSVARTDDMMTFRKWYNKHKH